MNLGSGNVPMDWSAVAFMGALMSVQCGAVMTLAEWYRHRDQLVHEGQTR